MNLYLYNSLSRKKELFIPSTKDIKLYVCGPTVYNTPHIGNARSIVVYDLLFRTLNYLYGKNNVIYVRNITDVDDKINQAAIEQNITINQLTSKITIDFHNICLKLNCLAPTYEPKATDHINEMINMIELLIQKNNAYVANNHVYYRIESFENYGKLCGRTITEMFPGARIDISDNKNHPGDFVLWKPASEKDDLSSIWDSPWGQGRPGWHIECSAMSHKYLGTDFDIHGGGIDLIFPHHTNEIAQSCAAYEGSSFAKYWIHNGFLTVNGEKMSKSLGNFITVDELFKNSIKGEVIRYMLLSNHYRKPMDFNDKLVSDSKKALDSFFRAIKYANDDNNEIDDKFAEYLIDDLNTAKLFARCHQIVKEINEDDNIETKSNKASVLRNSLQLIGLLHDSNYFNIELSNYEIEDLISQRNKARAAKNWQLSDDIRMKLQKYNVILEDNIDGSTIWRIKT